MNLCLQMYTYIYVLFVYIYICIIVRPKYISVWSDNKRIVFRRKYNILIVKPTYTIH